MSPEAAVGGHGTVGSEDKVFDPDLNDNVLPVLPCTDGVHGVAVLVHIQVIDVTARDGLHTFGFKPDLDRFDDRVILVPLGVKYALPDIRFWS